MFPKGEEESTSPSQEKCLSDYSDFKTQITLLQEKIRQGGMFASIFPSSTANLTPLSGIGAMQKSTLGPM